jgi:phytoene synthase
VIEAQSQAIETVKAADPDRYLSVLYAPEEKRPALFALYAFNAEIASVRDRIREALPGEIRLQWWRDAIAQGEAGGHPLAEALLTTIGRHALPKKPFDDYLEARVFDLYNDPMPGRAELEGYCGETASALIQLAAMILDADATSSAAEAAGHAGCAQAITGLIRLIPLHRARGQCYVPGDILAACGTSAAAFLDGKDPASAGRAVAAMAALAAEHLAAFEGRAPAIPQSLRPAFLPLALTAAYLEKIGGAVDPTTSIADISAVRRHWLMLKRASKGWDR